MSELSLTMDFDTILEKLELERYLGHVSGMTEAETRAWMWDYYRKELERVRLIKGNISEEEFESYFFRLYAYNQKVQVIDHEALVYCENKDNASLKAWIWLEIYNIYDQIKHFKGIEKYHAYKISGYKDADEWMREIFAETIGECLERYDYQKTDSLVLYTIYIFSNFRLVDDIRRRIALHEAEKQSSEDELEQPEHIRKHIKRLNQTASMQAVDGLEAEMLFNRVISRIVSLMIQIYEKKRKKDDSRLNKADYFRFYFTEMIIDMLKICKDAGVDAEDLTNEREVLEAVSQMLLNYIMEECCNTYLLVMETPTRTYDDILRDGNKMHISMPINEAIYTLFINEVLRIKRSQDSIAASIAKYRAMYRKQMMTLKDGFTS